MSTERREPRRVRPGPGANARRPARTDQPRLIDDAPTPAAVPAPTPTPTPTPTIEELRPSPRDRALLAVRAGGRIVARLDEALAAELDLRPGVAWTPELAARAAHLELVGRARRAGVRLLGKSDKTRAELRERLLRAGHAPEVVDDALDRLQRAGALSDERVARRAAERAATDRPAGTGAVRARLESRGVDAPTTSEATRDLDAPGAELARAKGLITPLACDARAQPRAGRPGAAHRKALALLARRGFDEDVAMRAIEEVLGPVPDSDGRPDFDDAGA